MAAGSESTPAARGSAIRNAIRRLEALAPNGQWDGFPTLAGRSDVWVTAFTAAHLKAVAPHSRCLTRARRALAKAQQPNGGWGYGGYGVPPDADSTAWCLAAIGSSRSISNRRLTKAADFLESHRVDGGFTTYLPESGIRAFIQAPADASIAGWTSVHADVLAAVLATNTPPRGALDARMLLGQLAAAQTAAGLIQAYWWRCPWYTLALALRAFCVHRLRPPQQFIRRALEALDGRRLAHGGYGLGADSTLDSFTTAFALEAYVHLEGAKRNRTVSGIAAALLAAQREDGGWEGGFVLRIPAPSVLDPNSVSGWKAGAGGGNAFVKDEHGVFATALACYALDIYQSAKQGDYAGLKRTWPEVAIPAIRYDDRIATVAVMNPPEAERCKV